MTSLLTRAMISSMTLPSVADTGGFLTGAGFLAAAGWGIRIGRRSLIRFFQSGLSWFLRLRSRSRLLCRERHGGKQRRDHCKITHVVPHL